MRFNLTPFVQLTLLTLITCVLASPTPNQPHRRQRIKRDVSGPGGIIAIANSTAVVEVASDTATTLIVYRPSPTAQTPSSSSPGGSSTDQSLPAPLQSIPAPLNAPDDSASPISGASTSTSTSISSAGEGTMGSNRIVAAGGSAGAMPSSSTGAGTARATFGGDVGLGLIVGMAGIIGMGMIWVL